MSFFDKFPLINYAGHNVRNLMAKADLTPRTRSDNSIFFPYTMSGDDRSDVLAHKYYDDSNYDWLIWMANRTVDPYYDLTLNEDDFIKFIKKKYGTAENSRRKIAFYRNEWVGDNQTITVLQFEGLSAQIKRYYDPVLNENLNVVGYSRKKKDWIVNTNSTIQMTLENISSNFIMGEEVKVGPNYAFVQYFGDSQINLMHINGTFNEGDVLVGQESGATGEILSIDNQIDNIPESESSFWSPVSYFDYESEKNLSKKEIKLIDNRLKEKVESELKKTMNSR